MSGLYVRKIQRIGGQHVINIPRDICAHLKVKRGDFLVWSEVEPDSAVAFSLDSDKMDEFKRQRRLENGANSRDGDRGEEASGAGLEQRGSGNAGSGGGNSGSEGGSDGRDGDGKPGSSDGTGGDKRADKAGSGDESTRDTSRGLDVARGITAWEKMKVDGDSDLAEEDRKVVE